MLKVCGQDCVLGLFRPGMTREMDVLVPTSVLMHIIDALSVTRRASRRRLATIKLGKPLPATLYFVRLGLIGRRQDDTRQNFIHQSRLAASRR